MIHARDDYNRIQDPALSNPSLLSDGSSPIAEDEPVFLVRASDQGFAKTVKAWAAAHLEAGGDASMADAAERQIVRAAAWQKNNRRKVADAPDGVLQHGSG